jgi:hypothetical protein
MDSITQVAQEMQNILTDEADQLACQKGFVQRKSKMSGAKFVQSLVFGWMSNPQASLEELTQTAASVGVSISPQGLQDRFSRQAADFLQAVLAKAVQRIVVAQPVAIPILDRFTNVFIQDSSQVVLPDELASIWRGCGNAIGTTQSVVKIEVRWEMRTGQLIGPYLENGRINEHQSWIEQEPVPEGSLCIADLGYWSLNKMRARGNAKCYWLSYLRANTIVFDENLQRHNLLELLQAQTTMRAELAVYLGEDFKLPARLLAVRVHQEVADRRRFRIYDAARRQQRPPNPQALALAEWTIVVTNVPVEQLSLREALILIRVRWQIELLFKLWKSHGRIDEWRSHNPWRILCEVYMKLLGLLFQHWLLILSCWQFPDRSLFKAVQTIQRFGLSLARAFMDLNGLVKLIEAIQQCLLTGCRIKKSKIYRRSFQLLLDCQDGALA